MGSNQGETVGDARTLALARVVFELTQRFNEFTSPDDLFAAFADGLETLLTYDRIAIVVSRDGGREVSHRFSRGDSLELRRNAAGDAAEAERLYVLREPLLYDIREDQRFAGDTERFAQRYRQAAIAPLTVDHAGVGLLTIMSKQADRWNESDLWVLSSLAGALGIMLAGSNLRHEAEQRQQEAEFIAEMGLVVSSIRDADELMRLSVERIAAAFAAPAAIYLVHQDRLKVGAVSAPPQYDMRNVRLFTASMIEFDENPVSSALAHDPMRDALDISMSDDDTAGINKVLAAELRARGMLRILAMPIVLDDQNMGVLAVAHIRNKGENPLISRQRQPAMVKRLAQYLAPALRNTWYYEDLMRALNESEVLRRILSDTASRNDPEDGLDIVVRAAQMLYGADYVAIARVEGAQLHWLMRAGGRIQVEDPVAPLVTPASDKLLAMLERLMPILVRDFPIDPPVDPHTYPLHVEEGLRSSLIAPFPIEDMSIGLLIVGFREVHRFDAADIRFARSLASGVAASRMRGRGD